MKKVLLLGLTLVALISAILMGTTAVYASVNPSDGAYYSGGQEWYLFRANPSADYTYDSTGTGYHTYMMQRAIVPGLPGSLYDGNSTFSFGTGDTITFFADEKANADVTFPSGKWILDLQRLSKGAGIDSKWGNNISARVGYYDGSTYTWFGTFAHSGTNSTGTVETYDITISSQYVPVGDTMVVELTNNGLAQDIRESDGTNMYSPESDPGYPLPEIAAGILLGGGLVGLVAFIVVRKRKSAATM
jgi:hypothetical protein